jgi:hypothetical protein
MQGQVMVPLKPQRQRTGPRFRRCSSRRNWPANGTVELSIGCGGHFRHPATWVMPLEPKPVGKRQDLSAGMLRDLMLAGTVKPVNELPK